MQILRCVFPSFSLSYPYAKILLYSDFGKDNKGSREKSLRDISFLEDSIDELERKEQARSQEAEKSAKRKGLPIREQVHKSKASCSHHSSDKFIDTMLSDSQFLPSPKPTSVKEDDHETDFKASSNLRATTPSVWATSDEEVEGHVDLQVTPLDAERKNADDSQNEIVCAEADSSNLNEKANPQSQNSSKPVTGTESPIKEPTPAQRHVQNFSKPAFPFHNGARSTDPSQTQSQVHTQSDSSAINESSASFDMSQSRYGVGQLSTSAMLKQQVPHIDLRREALERDRERPPRILVPDSDVSGGASQQGHSQSQSQSQSQDGSFRPLLPSQPHNTDTTDTQPQTGQMLGDYSTTAKAPNYSSQPPSILGPKAKEITVGQNGKHEFARFQSTSQTQTDSLRSIDDPFFDQQRSKPVVKQRKSSPPHGLSSHKNSRHSRRHEGTQEDDDKGIEKSHEDDEAPNIMDVDDARTHAMLLGSTHRGLDRDETSPGASHLSLSSKDKQFTIKGRVGSPHPKGEHQYTSASLSPGCSQQPSPSAHLGKRPRRSSISFQQSSPPISEGTRKRTRTPSSAPLRKKARCPPPEDKYAVQRVEHEPEAWHTASFMQLPTKKHSLPITRTLSSVREGPKRTNESRPPSSSQDQSVPQDPGSNSSVGRKSTSADLSLEPRSREIEPSAFKLRSTSPALCTGSHRAAAAEPLKKPAKKSTSFQRESARKLSGVEAGTLSSPVPGSTLSYSNGKVFVDFTLRRELGALQWINWSDVERNLLKIGRLRHKEVKALKKTK